MQNVVDSYCWEENGAREKPRKENDHAMDELRYFAASVAAREEQWSGSGAIAVERKR